MNIIKPNPNLSSRKKYIVIKIETVKTFIKVLPRLDKTENKMVK